VSLLFPPAQISAIQFALQSNSPISFQFTLGINWPLPPKGVYSESSPGKHCGHTMASAANSENLANWLASEFPYLCGASSPNNLTNETNADVASLFLTFFGVTGQKTNAQILAGALACYATSTNLAGTAGGQYGFNSSGGTRSKTYNVGRNGTSIGLSNKHVLR
jgi:hypothetical protein